MINIENNFYNANEAFEYFYKTISKHGTVFADTRTLFNVGFTIHKPLMNIISDEKRNWNLNYAKAEWEWYLSGDPKISTLGEIYGKIPPIWERMADVNGDVNSNYGWQWKRNQQIDYIVGLLNTQKHTRQAAISIYDCKEHDTFTFDTPCTYAVQFTILNNKLNMSVVMRSNDLWFGFCNDQYQFSKLQHYIWNRLGNFDDFNEIELGTYFHFAHNLHLYNNKI